jgi:hypothetical protein
VALLPAWFQPGELYFYLVAGGVVLVVIALLLYILPLRHMKVPGILAGSLGGLAAGFGLGIGALLWAGYHKDVLEKPAPAGLAEGGQAASGPPGRAGGGGGGGGMARGGGPGRGGGRGRGGPGGRGPGGGPPPTARSELASLIIKLDLLTHPPLAGQLTADEKTKLAQQLKGLDPAKPPSEEEAKKRLDSLTAALDKHKEALEDAGFRWPGQSPALPSGGDTANPLQEKKVAEHLRSLQKSL